MALIHPTVRLLAHFAPRYGFAGDVVTIGHNEVYLTADQALAVFGRDLAPGPAPDQRDDADLLAALGFASVAALDFPGSPGIDIAQDLNLPLDAAHHGRFDAVLEVGTMEHVFDVRAVLTSIHQLLRPGGQVVHLSPTQGGANHGLYCFQPTLFFSWYRTNGYVDLEAHLVELPSTDRHADDDRVRVIPVENHNNLDFHPSTPQTYLLFRAVKGADAPARVPMQEFYGRIVEERIARGLGEGELLPDDLYRSIVGLVPENDHARLLERAFWV